jgi:hypothetical protein
LRCRGTGRGPGEDGGAQHRCAPVPRPRGPRAGPVTPPRKAFQSMTVLVGDLHIRTVFPSSEGEGAGVSTQRPVVASQADE